MKHQRSTVLSDFENALLLHRAGRLKEAETIYKRMPHHPDALHLRGLIAQQDNDHEQAIDLFKKAIRLKPSHAPYYFSIEAAYRALGRVDELAAAFLKLVAAVPRDASVHEKLGSALRDLGNFNDAIVCYESAIALDPLHADAHSNLGVVLKIQGRLDEAAVNYRKAIEIKPDFAEAHSNLGNVYKEQGKFDEAVTCYENALALKPELAEAHFNLGNVYRLQGKLDAAFTCYSTVQALKPDFAPLYNSLGAVFKEQGDLAQAIDSYQQAITLKPDYAEAYSNLGNVLKDLGESDMAVTCYQHALAIDPDIHEAHYNLGIVLQNTGKLDEAVLCYRRALSLKPDLVPAYNNLGLALADQGMAADAAFCFRKCLELDPDAVDSYFNLGNLLRSQGKLHDALDCHMKALALDPGFAKAHNALGLVFADQGRFADALTCYETALMLRPAFADAYYNMGSCFSIQGKLDEAIEWYAKAIAADPKLVGAFSNMGLAYHGKGRLEEAIDCYQKALALDPGSTIAHSNLLFAMQYSASFTPEQMAAEHVEFGRRFETPLKAHWQPHANARDPRKRLKIGYVSPDFNRHAVSYSIEPVLARHDKSQVEIFCYYSNTKQDDVTQRLQALADHWIACKHLSDEQLAAQIRADGIDILVDLAGHTGGNRLLAFARKPAPVQLTYLGYPATTGLSAIDYRITDSHAEPPGMTEQFNVEQLWRMPDMFCVYRAHDNSPAVIDHPPCADNGHVTFGCFNNFSKVTDSVLALWARLLDKVPDARLMLEIHGIDDPAQYAAVEQRLARLGIPAERQILIPRKPENQYVLYNRIDIALDPFPCNGGTTSLDTLWMGVPFVTLAGRHFTSRMGVTMLTNAGMQELIAHSEDAYVEIAAALALDAGRLARLRAGLRERVQAGPIMDAQRFTRNLEQALRSMWQTWCESAQEH